VRGNGRHWKRRAPRGEACGSGSAMAFVQPNPDGPEGEPMVALFELGARRAADAVRNGEQTAEALVEALLARCAASPLNAFITLEADRLRAAARGAAPRRQ